MKISRAKATAKMTDVDRNNRVKNEGGEETAICKGKYSVQRVKSKHKRVTV